MLLTKEIYITIERPNIKYYKKLGYDIKLKDNIKIPIEHLPKTSHKKVKIKCDSCGKEKESYYFAYNKYLKNSDVYSCNKCNDTNRKKTLLEKYGVDSLIKNEELNKKRKKTLLEKYGYEHQCKSNKIKNKIINTNKKKYGVDYPTQSKEIRNKINKTNIKKYGNINSLVNKNTQLKTFKTMKKKYGVKYSTQSKEILQKIINSGKESKIEKILKINNDIKKVDYKNNKFIVNCDKCNNSFEITPHNYYYRKHIYKSTICTKCNPLNNNKISETELKVLDYIKNNYKLEIILNKRNIINPYELDIYLPDLNIAFEFNGLYWHNELYKDKNYHLNKTKLCESKGIQLIHIWEDNWVYKQDIVKSMILNKLNLTPNKIYARKTEVKEVDDNKLIREFLKNNHIQGFVGSKIKLGLFYENKLVSLMTFGKRRVAMGKKSTNEGEYELLRFCNELNTNILGGVSKLFKYFINNYNPKEITTYADRSYSQGKMYKQLGFKFQEKTQPNYYYIIDGVRHHRFNFRKDKLIKEGFDSNKTEHEIMLERNIYRIYDSGNLKYKF